MTAEPALDGVMRARPRPWRYNPSRWGERWTIAGLALAAAAVSAYMAMYQYGLIDSVWDPFFGEQSHQVLDSDISHRMARWFRMPDAALGAIGYVADALLALAGSTRRWQFRPWLVATFGLVVIPMSAVSFTLVAAQGLVLKLWCLPCLVTALLSLALMVLAADEVVSSFLYLRRIRRDGGCPGDVWSAFWGRPSNLAWLSGEEMIRSPS